MLSHKQSVNRLKAMLIADPMQHFTNSYPKYTEEGNETVQWDHEWEIRDHVKTANMISLANNLYAIYENCLDPLRYRIYKTMQVLIDDSVKRMQIHVNRHEDTIHLFRRIWKIYKVTREKSDADILLTLPITYTSTKNETIHINKDIAFNPLLLNTLKPSIAYENLEKLYRCNYYLNTPIYNISRTSKTNDCAKFTPNIENTFNIKNTTKSKPPISKFVRLMATRNKRNSPDEEKRIQDRGNHATKNMSKGISRRPNKFLEI